MYPPSVLDRILFATRYTRHLDRNGYLRFQNWKLYGERGLAKAPVTVWIYEGSLKVEHQAVTLAQYSVGLQNNRKHVQKVSNPRLVETPFRSPQLALFDLGPDEWLFYWRASGYALARRKRRVEGLVQPLLFDFREKKRLCEPIKSARLHHHAVTSMSFPHPLMTTRAARIAIPYCPTYRHGHEQLSSRRDE